MPARRLDRTPGSLGLYDVVGLDATAVSHFVCHAGLSREWHAAVTSETPIGLAHMGPPLHRAGPAMAVQCVGQVPLTEDETQRISLFIDELELEYEASSTPAFRQYIVHPHCVSEQETDATPTRRRFSCGGFVIEAYRFADIDLLVTDEVELPPVSIETLRIAYSSPVQLRGLSTPERRRPLGLLGDGPWGIVLPGYILHALARTGEAIRHSGPYTPQAGDEYYPARAPQRPHEVAG